LPGVPAPGTLPSRAQRCAPHARHDVSPESLGTERRRPPWLRKLLPAGAACSCRYRVAPTAEQPTFVLPGPGLYPSVNLTHGRGDRTTEETSRCVSAAAYGPGPGSR